MSLPKVIASLLLLAHGVGTLGIAAIARDYLNQTFSKVGPYISMTETGRSNGEFLVAVTASDVDYLDGERVTFETGAGCTPQTFTLDAEAVQVKDVVASVWSLRVTDDDCEQVHFGGGGDGMSRAIVLLRLTGEATTPFDKSSTGTGSGTNPKSGTTATTSQADEILIGSIGTEGPSGDDVGTWQQSFTAGVRVGTSGGGAAGNVTISEGYRIVSSASTYEAEKTGITDRDWSAAIATYKEAVPPTGVKRLMLMGIGMVLVGDLVVSRRTLSWPFVAVKRLLTAGTEW